MAGRLFSTTVAPIMEATIFYYRCAYTKESAGLRMTKRVKTTLYYQAFLNKIDQLFENSTSIGYKSSEIVSE
jgi:hypothetical protein